MDKNNVSSKLSTDSDTEQHTFATDDKTPLEKKFGQSELTARKTTSAYSLIPSKHNSKSAQSNPPSTDCKMPRRDDDRHTEMRAGLRRGSAIRPNQGFLRCLSHMSRKNLCQMLRNGASRTILR